MNQGCSTPQREHRVASQIKLSECTYTILWHNSVSSNNPYTTIKTVMTKQQRMVRTVWCPEDNGWRHRSISGVVSCLSFEVVRRLRGQIANCCGKPIAGNVMPNPVTIPEHCIRRVEHLITYTCDMMLPLFQPSYNQPTFHHSYTLWLITQRHQGNLYNKTFYNTRSTGTVHTSAKAILPGLRSGSGSVHGSVIRPSPTF